MNNLYWLLHECLVKPVGLDTWYYYPFGTTSNISYHEFGFQRTTKHPHHVLYHFDQEPLWTSDLGSIYDSHGTSWSQRTLKILANSEHSDLKRQICRSRHMVDWYFFYHGFAALDWFQDSRYIANVEPISCAFNSLNHNTKNLRSYRMALTARLFDLGIAHCGDISLHASYQDCKTEMQDPDSRLSPQDKDLINRHLCSSRLPITVDDQKVNGSFSAHFGYHEYRLWQKAFLHVVNETVFYHPKLHLTEKVFKPIVALRPFVLAAAPGNLAYLRGYGFKTFDAWINESYDDIQDTDQRLDMIALEIKKICEKPLWKLKEMHAEMLPVLEFNKRHFFSTFRSIIVEELVNNFDSCLRKWNNGRVDGRTVPFHPDLQSVKNVLTQ